MTNTLGTVMIIHGMAEHHWRYQNFEKQLQDLGYNTISFDLPGHGEAHKDHLGHMTSVSEILTRIYEKLDDAPRPLILFGHSMGSLIARAFFYENPQFIDALILSGSPYKPTGLTIIRPLIHLMSKFYGNKPSSLLDNVLNNTLAKSLPKGSGRLDWLSFNKDNVNAYINDPYCGFPLTYQGYATLMDLFHYVYNKPQMNFTKEIPVLFVIGLYDPCPDFKRDGFNKAIYHLQSHIETPIHANIYEHSRHELLNDNDRELVIEDIVQFLTNLHER